MTVETKYDMGDTVYFITDPVQDQFVITGFSVRPNGMIYYCSCCGEEKIAYDFEISEEKTIL